MKQTAWTLLPLMLLVGGCGSSPGPTGHEPPRVVDRNEVEATPVPPGPIRLETEIGRLLVEVLEPGLVKTTLLRPGQTKSAASFAVDPEYVKHPPPFQVSTRGTMTTIVTENMSLSLSASPFSVEQRDAKGNLVLKQKGASLWTERGARLSFSLTERESVFGLGDKARGMNRRGQVFEMWNTDAFAWKVDQDPLYKTFPFFVFVGESEAHGLFVDSPSRAAVDVGKADPSELVYEIALSDAVDLYFVSGPRPRDVLKNYTSLTGRPYLPPYWSLGYHQSRYGYKSEQEFRDLMKRFRKDRLPLDVLWLDIDYQKDFAPFTVNPDAFDDFPAFVADLKDAGIQPVCITDLHIKSYQGSQSPVGYAPFDTGVAGDHFIRRDDGSLFEGEVWPGKSVFPEFTRKETRAWWGGLYEEFIAFGVSGFWNDMNEPALFNAEKTMPEDQMHRMDEGPKQPHTLIHNAYGALNVEATFEGVKRLSPGKRPFVLTRAAFAGAQRYSASWTGDNVATREHLAATIPTLTNLGVSGYPNIGADVGGFDGCPSAELLAEWMEIGAFQPFYRNHSGKGTCLREPWVHGAPAENRMRRAIERRYVYLPYLYTVFEEASRTGQPVMRPLWYEFPEHAASRDNASLFFVGPHLLVAPKLTDTGVPRLLSLPPADFYRIDTGQLYLRNDPVSVAYPSEDSIVLFARSGAILPTGPVLQHTGEKTGGPLTLHVFPGQDCHGQVYTDDGQTYAYKSGDYRRLDVTCEANEKGFSLRVASEGSHVPWWKEIVVAWHGIGAAPRTVFKDDETPLQASYDAKTRTSSVTLPNTGEAFSLRGSW